MRDAVADDTLLPELVDEADLDAVTLTDGVAVALVVPIAEPEPDAATEVDGANDSLDMGDAVAIDAEPRTVDDGVENNDEEAGTLREGELLGEIDGDGDSEATAVEDAIEKDTSDDAEGGVERDTEREPELDGEPLTEREAMGVRDVDCDGAVERDTGAVRLSAMVTDGLLESDGDADEEREMVPLADTDGEFVDDALDCALFDKEDCPLADAVCTRGEGDTDVEMDEEPLCDGEPLGLPETDGDADCVGERVKRIDAEGEPDADLSVLSVGEALENKDGVESRDCVEQEEIELGSDGMSVPRDVAVPHGDMERVTEMERDAEDEPESEYEPETLGDTSGVRDARLDIEALGLPEGVGERKDDADEHADNDDDREIAGLAEYDGVPLIDTVAVLTLVVEGVLTEVGDPRPEADTLERTVCVRVGRFVAVMLAVNVKLGEADPLLARDADADPDGE